MADMCVVLFGFLVSLGFWTVVYVVGCRESERLRALLVEANDAFDELTGDYPKELVDGEGWRAFRSDGDE